MNCRKLTKYIKKLKKASGPTIKMLFEENKIYCTHCTFF